MIAGLFGRLGGGRRVSPHAALDGSRDSRPRWVRRSLAWRAGRVRPLGSEKRAAARHGPASGTTGRVSTAACAPCGRTTCSSSGSSTASAGTSPTWSTPVQDLSGRGVGLRVLAAQGAQVDTTTAAGRLVFGIFAALAEFERELIRERTMAGLEAARARGRKGGRKFALSKAQVRLAQPAMAHRDTSVSELCRELGIRPVTLYRYVGPQGQLREQGRKGPGLLNPKTAGFRPLPQTTRIWPMRRHATG